MSSHQSHSVSNRLKNPAWIAHEQAVEAIQRSVRRYHENGESFRIFHGSTNSTRSPATKGRRLVDTSGLCHVLEVDREQKTVTVEPNVPMDRLVEATLPHGLIPLVVMEFPGITAGGGYNGTSGESSSFRHGFFDRTVNRAEMILANGEKIQASRNENSDLLDGAAGAVGTLGITTLLEIQLCEAKKYVLTIYHPVRNVQEAIETTLRAMENPQNDYIDGILFSPQCGAIITGTRTDVLPESTRTQTFSAARDPWYYMHVQEQVRERGRRPVQEGIPLAEYLFRYDRGGFWVAAAGFQYFHTPCNTWTRWLLDPFMHTRMLYKALHASGHATKFFVQDLALPFDQMAEFVKFSDEKLNIYPLWLCPLRQKSLPTMHPHHSQVDLATGEAPLLLNIGVWGYGPTNRRKFIQVNRELEAKLRELGGMKWLYAHSYQSEEDFWSEFDQEWYKSLREKYHATTLPSVYDKVQVSTTINPERSLGERLFELWPIPGLYGVAKSFRSGAFRDDRASTWKSWESRRTTPK